MSFDKNYVKKNEHGLKAAAYRACWYGQQVLTGQERGRVYSTNDTSMMANSQ